MAFFPIYQHGTDNVAAQLSSAALSISGGGSVVSGHALENLILGGPSKYAAFSGAVVLDFNSPQTIRFVALIHHTLTAGSPDVKWQANATDDWNSPAFERAFTIPAMRKNGFSTNPFLDLSDVAPNYRYHRLTVGASPVDIGTLWASPFVRTLPTGIGLNATSGQDASVVEHRTYANVSLIRDLNAVQRLLEGEAIASDALIGDLRTWWQSANGRAQAHVFVRDPAINDAWLVRFGSQYQEHRLSRVAWSVSFTLQEVSPGLSAAELA
jgi:hypothetical protein